MDIRVTHDRGERRMSTRYLILDKEYERTDRDEILRPAFDINASHHKDRKAFLVTYNRVLVSPRIVRHVIELRDEDPVPLERSGYWVPVARYSQKALDEVYRDAVAAFTNLSEQERENVLLWATRAKG